MYGLFVRNSSTIFTRGRRTSLRGLLCGAVPAAAYHATFRHRDLVVEATASSKRAVVDDNPKFGTHFANNMFEVEWSATSGWAAPRIVPYHNLELSPAAKVLHYAIECFEGMKASRGDDNKIRLFRPQLHLERLLRSAERAVLPSFSPDEMLKCLIELIKVNREWVPKSSSQSLYIRPTMISTEPTLGVKASQNCLLFTVCSPVGSYRSSHFRDSSYISLLVDPQMQRVCAGGVALAKMGCNYAPTICHLIEANKRKCEDILYVCGHDHQLTETTSMNIFVVLVDDKGHKELIAVPATDFVLPGITRRSYIEIASRWSDVKVTERSISMKEMVDASKAGRLLEVFGSGTATVVSPVGQLLYVHDGIEEKIVLNEDEENSLATKLKREIDEIKMGRIIPEWTVTVGE